MRDCCRQLQDGNILQHGVADGSKVTLLPNVETGLVVSLTFDVFLFVNTLTTNKQLNVILLSVAWHVVIKSRKFADCGAKWRLYVCVCM